LDALRSGPSLGGLCRSETIDGFVADCCGGHIIFSKRKDVLAFMLDALGPGGTHQSPRKSAIWYRGRYVQYPFENGLGDLPPEDNFECLKGYIEAHMARKNGAPQPGNFADWCLWRFGRGISEKFMFPYNEKIWKVALTDLSTRWVAGRVPDAPVDDVLKASIGIKTEGYVHQATFWYPLEGGFESVVKAIAKPLDAARIHCGTKVRSVKRTAAGWLVDGRPFDRVVSTIPLRELAPALGDVPPMIRASFDRLAYTSLASVIVAIDEPPRDDRSWIYFPHHEAGAFNRVTHLSNYSPRNAPPGKSSLMAEVTYRGEAPDLEKLQQDVVRHLHEDGLLDRKRVLFTRAWTNQYAYILYTHDLEENLDRVRHWLAEQGIEILGRFGNYDYYNSDQCIAAVLDWHAANIAAKR
jgi:protoporphyrinogen oxidase